MAGLKGIFGPSKKEIWSQIANEIGGEYINEGFFGNEALVYPSGEWEIVLDTYVVSTGQAVITFTRLRAPFKNKDGFYFNCYHETFFSSIKKLFGMQDIVIGHPYFDDNYIIQSNNEEKIKLLLGDSKMRELITGIPKTGFKIEDDDGLFGKHCPEGTDVLYFYCSGVITDKAVLRNLFDLFSLTLERLVQMDSAYADDPNVKLI